MAWEAVLRPAVVVADRINRAFWGIAWPNTQLLQFTVWFTISLAFGAAFLAAYVLARAGSRKRLLPGSALSLAYAASFALALTLLHARIHGHIRLSEPRSWDNFRYQIAYIDWEGPLSAAHRMIAYPSRPGILAYNALSAAWVLAWCAFWSWESCRRGEKLKPAR